MKQIFKTDNWLLVNCRYGEDDATIRFRGEMPSIAARLAHRSMAVLKWRYLAKKDGFPTAKELAQLSKFEDRLEELIEGPAVAVQVACVTGGGRRTWRYFMDRREPFNSIARGVFAEFPSAKIELIEVDDPEWEALSEFEPLID